jgi:RecA-family ATPase
MGRDANDILQEGGPDAIDELLAKAKPHKARGRSKANNKINGHANDAHAYAQQGPSDEAIDQVIDESDAIAEMVAEICNGVDNDPIPPREWLLGRTFCKEFIGGIAGPGGTGKTALRTAQLMSVAVDRPLTGETVYRRAKVFGICLEDSRNEYRRRQRACLLHHGINYADTVGYFYWITVTERGGKIAVIGPDGKVMPGTLAGVIEAAIVKLGIELVHFDPFVKAHGMPENDNRLIDDVMNILSSISARHNVALDSTYHVPKGPSDPGNADKFRGGGAARDAMRLGKTVTPMSPEEAIRFGIPEQDRRFYIRYDDAKINLSPYQHTSWFKLVSVPLGNATDIYPDGDNVQTVEVWHPPDAWADMNASSTNRILDAIDKGMPNGERYSAANAARERAAWKVVADVTGKEEGPAKEIVKGWMKSRLLFEEEYKSPAKREMLKGLRVDNSKRPTSSPWVPE